MIKGWQDGVKNRRSVEKSGKEDYTSKGEGKSKG